MGERASRSSTSIGASSAASVAAAAGLPLPGVPYGGGGGSIYEQQRPRRGSSASLQSLRNSAGARASITLSHGGDAALNLYRETAKRTNDPNLQWEFAKYLLECAEKDDGHAANAADEPMVHAGQRSLRDEAIYWINKLARASHPEACVVKARWHQLGRYGMVQSEDKAAALYTTASKQNHPRASYRLGEIYERRRGIAKAVQYYNRASLQNDALANLRLGKAHLTGELKLARDYNMALRFLRRASDAATMADKESHEAPFLLAQLIGDLHPQIRLPPEMLAHDPSGAFEQFQRAAEFGHTAAMFELAYAYEYACLGLEMAEPDLSIQWYRRAAEHGHSDAMVGLSGWYLTGLEGILTPDDALAFDWCYRAAAQHHLPKAEYALGYYYEVGIGVPSNINEAMRWYEIAASHGSRDARFRLSKVDGTGATKLRKSEYGTVKLKKHKKGRECTVM
ncbi:hypothetical protein SYNPS1DRAFT_14817 [Syncephalis pseudoplumigaleata]|uniref:HCP-like protein n=1 Tax=Syncephalis pseudoplumigaleata TaxID=1712513 RepID=A0A4P9Z0S4_9FUNG|nr:hypothetical protein SYNPS1DRAFT_14817 [Syncephalis pseudoplumigaleata]|eukprot:RKP26016.1 hypothetical protein SYNPS1DRAFT_14817 [Syncephalis pseudoplumigaleata]